jgi:hypothetical protein
MSTITVKDGTTIYLQAFIDSCTSKPATTLRVPGAPSFAFCAKGGIRECRPGTLPVLFLLVSNDLNFVDLQFV